MNRQTEFLHELAESGEELSPSKAPPTGSLLLSRKKWRSPEDVLLQERDGVWLGREIKDDGFWTPVEYYQPWEMIWLRWSKLYRVSPEDFVIADLKEMVEILASTPLDDIQ